MELHIGNSERIRILSRPDRMRIEVRGVLDAVVVKAISAILAAADDRDTPVELDLGGVHGHTDGGVAALARLVELDRAPLTYRAASQTGQAALLASFGRSFGIV